MGSFPALSLKCISYAIVFLSFAWHGTFKPAGTWRSMILTHFTPIYLVQRSHSGEVQGSVRLLPSVGPTMLRDTFPALLELQPAPSAPQIWESSRFAIDVAADAPKGDHGIARATYELFAGMVEFGISRQLTDIVTVTDVRMERILRRAGWPLRRIGSPARIGNTLAVAGYLAITDEIFPTFVGLAVFRRRLFGRQ